MFLLCLLMLGAPEGQALTLKPNLTFAEIPEDTDMFLQGSTDVAIHPNGDLYLVDSRSSAVFVWNKDGSFKTHFGKAGQGPGEFSFENGNSGGLIGFSDKWIYVFDSGSGFINIFDQDHNFIRNKALSVTRGRVDMFKVIDDENLLVVNSSWFSEVPYRQLARWSTSGELLNTLEKVNDETWRYGSENGARRVILIPYASTMATAFDEATKTIMVGDTATNVIKRYSADGKQVGEVTPKVFRRDITKEDVEEFKEQPWLQRNEFFKFDFPDRTSFYNTILPLEQGMVVGRLSTYYRNFEGVVVDASGQTQKRVTAALGINGQIYGSRGKIIALKSDEEGELSVHFLQPL